MGTGAALIKNSRSAKLTTSNGGTFTWAPPDSVANHLTARSIGDWRDWLLRPAELDVNVPPFAVVSLSVYTWFDATWIGGTASRIYMCKSVGMGDKFATAPCRIWLVSGQSKNRALTNVQAIDLGDWPIDRINGEYCVESQRENVMTCREAILSSIRRLAWSYETEQLNRCEKLNFAFSLKIWTCISSL